MLIIIDPGHGGNDPGATGPTGLKEKDVNLKLSNILSNILTRHDIDILFTREKDVRVSLEDRVKIANGSNADYFISIHCNSSKGNEKATGTEAYAYSKASEGNALARHVLDELAKEIKLPDRGIKYDSLYVVSKTTMPAVLVEVAFINNPDEEELLKNSEFLSRAGIGIAKGILKHLRLEFVEEKELDTIRIRLHGKEIEIEGIFQDGTNYIPVRTLEQMGYNLDWRDSTVVIDYQTKD